MIGAGLNRAEIEYAAMLAVLNFQTEFMKSHYTRARVRLVEDLIEVTLSRTTSVPAEDRLAETAEGRSLLQQVHTALFASGAALLKERLERDLGLTILKLFSHLDTAAGTNTIIVKLEDPVAEQPA